MTQHNQVDALDRFLAEIERRAFAMAQIATNDRDEALDIVQDAMIKLANSYAGKPIDEWAPLFYRILQNRIMDWHRRNKRWKLVRMFTGDYSKQEDNIAVLPEDVILLARDNTNDVGREKSLLALEKELKNLPLRQQQAFLLRAWEGMDTKQTALAMGCSEGSVKTHYSRAVHTLRERLEDHWP